MEKKLPDLQPSLAEPEQFRDEELNLTESKEAANTDTAETRVYF